MANRLTLAFFLAGLLAACQMPQPRGGLPQPPMPSIPSSSPSSPSTPSLPSPPSSPSAPTPSGSPPPSEQSGSEDSGDSSAGDSSSAGEGSEQLPMPSGAGSESEEGGASVEGLDEQLDAALEDFDESVTGEGGGATEDTIDILSPTGGGSSSSAASDEPLYEEGSPEEGGGPVENDELARRAEEGGGAGAEAEGQQAGNGNFEGGESSEASSEPIVPIPEDIGDGRNDDIVLRQVRDAAMKERNAELREKLWDEYRRIRDQR